MITADILANFQIGYDRHYVGVALHCIICNPNEHYTTASENDPDEDPGETLDLWVAAAAAHWEKHHRDHN